MFGKHYVNIRGQKLVKYRCSEGGGMLGGYYSKTIQRRDDMKAAIKTEETEAHNIAPTAAEQLVDIAIMAELEQVIRRCRMNFWHRKKFTNMFIADGESKSYQFEFDNASISFSSQIYPKLYRDKLHRLDEVIEKYQSLR